MPVVRCQCRAGERAARPTTRLGSSCWRWRLIAIVVAVGVASRLAAGLRRSGWHPSALRGCHRSGRRCDTRWWRRAGAGRRGRAARSAPDSPARSQAAALAANPELDPGTPIHGVAPGFTLSDQFGQPVSLRSFRGQVVILAFNDSECTTVCPLTTTAMMDAKAMLGRAGSRVQLLGVDADPAATSVEDVWSYSELHGMLHAWRFLTGSLPQLKQVWKHYGIEAAVQRGQITHTPALFVIDPRGRLSRLYMTQMSYTAVPQLGQLLAQSASALLPGRPPVHADLSYARVQPTTPTTKATLPRARGGTIQLGPGKAARLYLFFATWDQETSGLGGPTRRAEPLPDARRPHGPAEADRGRRGERRAKLEHADRLPARLPQPLSYPVAIDRSGKIADGYEVLGVPWFVLISPTGQILYYREVSTSRAGRAPASWPATSAPRSPAHPRFPAPRRAHARTRRLTSAARVASPPGRTAARRVPSARRPAARAARLPGRDQRLGVLVRAMPIGVQPVRLRLRALRPPGRVPRRRHQRLSRRRPHVPSPAPRQLPQLPDHHHRPLVARRDRGTPHDHLHKPSRQSHIRARRPIRHPRNARPRHQQLRAR